jgi:hypothetical protein
VPGDTVFSVGALLLAVFVGKLWWPRRAVWKTPLRAAATTALLPGQDA